MTNDEATDTKSFILVRKGVKHVALLDSLCAVSLSVSSAFQGGETHLGSQSNLPLMGLPSRENSLRRPLFHVSCVVHASLKQRHSHLLLGCVTPRLCFLGNCSTPLHPRSFQLTCSPQFAKVTWGIRSSCLRNS